MGEIRDAEITLREVMEQCDRRIEEVDKRAWEAEDRAREAEDRVRESDMRAQESDMRAQESDMRVQEADMRAQESDMRAQESDMRAQESDMRAQESDMRAQESDMRAQESDMRDQEADMRAQEAEDRAQEAEDRVREVERIAELIQQEREVERRRSGARGVGLGGGEEEREWLVRRREIRVTGERLGGGGWGEVMVAEFRGSRVAAKVLHRQLQSSYYCAAFRREMNMAAKLRHPNLVQFLGASMDQEKVILMEMITTSLRQHIEMNTPNLQFSTAVSLDVAKALNYLHLMQPEAILHRDISSANVLLAPLPGYRWRAKVTDYGSVNWQNLLNTVSPGSPVYSAPESHVPALQFPQMDIFSFGVVMLETMVGQFLKCVSLRP